MFCLQVVKPCFFLDSSENVADCLLSTGSRQELHLGQIGIAPSGLGMPFAVMLI